MGNNDHKELEAALKKIRASYLAGVIVTVGQILIQMVSYISFGLSGVTDQNGLSTTLTIFIVVELAIILALCYGIYRKSKPCAIALLIYSVLAALLILAFGRLPLALIIVAFAAFQGIQGISTYRRLTSR
ncbi:MAG: hypothetical protein F6K30_03695 [Cyanothece sp. SIO2G6]|nr:hypothetical protein [Cyanothece sp. SIO2G6]